MWAYILLFTFVGPEMTQAERDEEAAATLEYERMRADGVSLTDIGAGRVKAERQEDRTVVARAVDESHSNEEKIDPEKGDVKRTEVI